MIVGTLLLVAALVAPQSAPRPIEITLTRTACFGTCPQYTVVLKGDGSVTYNGQRFVRVAGARTWAIDPAAVRALANEMVKDGFFDLQESYSSPMTDSPTVYTALRLDRRFKQIRDYIAGPAMLKQIERRIDAVSGAKAYVWIDGAAIRAKAKGGWRATDSEAAGWLWQAASAGDSDVLGALLAAGADASTVHDDGTTVLMAAAVSGDAECVRLLLAAGADPTFRDRTGRNAADRVRDAMNPAPPPRGFAPDPPRMVDATGKPPDYQLILTLLTNE